MSGAQQRDPAAMVAGLVVPGGGQLKRGELVNALLVLVATSFLWLAASLELVVNNMLGYPAPLHLAKELLAIKSPVTIVPHVVVAVLLAVTVHVGAAWFAGKER